MLVGLFGIGKILFVKILVGVMFNSEDVMVCIDVFEYFEKYVILCFIGVGFGYVGYEVGG